ncbi:DUF4145 domain-containing protein [Commensalibacter papalotli (ex Botero et al. 2024)]|uniref:DUF4145 domain-containing protein n=1 Tax=Commensalibacter papalotli (ex Botero et al. 2024) TaxID=2972766 RepID=A0ABM9HT04_9PROT|nr:DUF4145 domain-containing protein [Commensalibacter papalotli (ex Botero et al. 2024)]CAI3953176.1 unnamed protein product [Commensalibacter papalotli (ex Botero et al. 2024)]CAI3953695.1 unnamed protein product [Commensalibacter papalotli (ex Botero et al. 2024)]
MQRALIQNMNYIIYFNIFSKCRECKLPTIFSIYRNITNAVIHENIAERWLDKDDIAKETTKWTVYINQEEDGNLLDNFQIEKIIRPPVNISYQCPEHVPEDIKGKFDEAAQCHANDCIVASSMMLRLCLETVIKDLLKTNNEQKQKVYLSDGIKNLSEKNLISKRIQYFANEIRFDGNYAAHEGKMDQENLQDLFDFTIALLEDVYTQPKKIELSQERRAQRKNQGNPK